MNQPRSIYKTDFVPYDWMENNFNPNTDDFCSTENIDDCVQYISQEFCALGYPSIYLNSDSCPYAVNCDIVKLLNVTFELLGCTKDHAQAKEDIECRNQRLSADLVSQNKKNAQLRENVEVMERRYRSVLERERQLKEKNEKLTQAIKNEKNEAKKLSSQIQQQKVTYQHEIRKYESNINQLKARLKQIISDKNPDKKVATISPSSLLQRNSKERGKWKTGTVAKSNMEEMYISLISSYENRSQDMLKEITDYQQCFEYLQHEMQDAISLMKGEECDKMSFSNAMPLHMIWNGPNKRKELEERFQSLLCEIRESALGRMKNSLKMLDGENSEGQLSVNKELSVREGIKRSDSAKQDSESQKNNTLELERKKLLEKEKELSATSALIEKEKLNLEIQRLEVIKMAMQQEGAKSEWHRNLKSTPSFSVITTKDGLTAVPSALQLKQCYSAPSQQVKTLSPLWYTTCFESSKELVSESEDVLQPSSKCDTAPSTSKDIPQNINFPTCDLPKWAASCLDSDAQEFSSQILLSDPISSEELEVCNISVSEEQNLARLKAAFEDMESRRNHPSH